MRDFYLGIDPGQTGGIAIVDGTGGFVNCGDLPYVDKEVSPQAVAAWLPKHPASVFCALEYQQSMPQSSSRTMFNLGQSYGALKAILALSGIPYETPRPVAWKRAMGIPPGSDKEVSRAMALQLFPAAALHLARKRDDGRAEALLLAEFLRRKDRA